MRVQLNFARPKYPQQWQEYKIAKAEQGCSSACSFTLGGRRGFALRVWRFELVVTSLWRVEEHDVMRPHDDD